MPSMSLQDFTGFENSSITCGRHFSASQDHPGVRRIAYQIGLEQQCLRSRLKGLSQATDSPLKSRHFLTPCATISVGNFVSRETSFQDQYYDHMMLEQHEDSMDTLSQQNSVLEGFVPTQQLVNVRDDLANILIQLVNADRHQQIEGVSPALANCGHNGDTLLHNALVVLVEDTSDVEDDDLVSIPRSVAWACPFYIQDKQRHKECLARHALESIEDVRNHLFLAHRQPILCPVCATAFVSYAARDGHLRAQDCIPHACANFVGLDDRQLAQVDMMDLEETSMPEEEQWVRLWQIVFPNSPKPESPYLSCHNERTVSTIREVWKNHGLTLVCRAVSGRLIQGYIVNDEETLLNWLYATALDRAIDIAILAV